MLAFAWQMPRISKQNAAHFTRKCSAFPLQMLRIFKQIACNLQANCARSSHNFPANCCAISQHFAGKMLASLALFLAKCCVLRRRLTGRRGPVGCAHFSFLSVGGSCTPPKPPTPDASWAGRALALRAQSLAQSLRSFAKLWRFKGLGSSRAESSARARSSLCLRPRLCSRQTNWALRAQALRAFFNIKSQGAEFGLKKRAK